MTINIPEPDEPFEAEINNSNLNAKELSILKSTLDEVCSIVNYFEKISEHKQNKLIEFSVEFCDNSGVCDESVDVLLGSRINDDQRRELVIEVNGILVETIVYDAKMAIVSKASLAIMAAILEVLEALSSVGWVMAVVRDDSYYVFNDVVARASSKAAGEEIKIATINLWDILAKKTTNSTKSMSLMVPNTEIEIFKQEIFRDILQLLPENFSFTITTASNTTLTLNSVENKKTMTIFGSKIFKENSDTQKMKNWVQVVVSTGVDLIHVNGIKTYTILSDTNKPLNKNVLKKILLASVVLCIVDIDVENELNLGKKGTYIVEGGDTFAQIAKRNGLTMKGLLEFNTWLMDEGKVHFEQGKALVDDSIEKNDNALGCVSLHDLILKRIMIISEAE